MLASTCRAELRTIAVEITLASNAVVNGVNAVTDITNKHVAVFIFSQIRDECRQGSSLAEASYVLKHGIQYSGSTIYVVLVLRGEAHAFVANPLIRSILDNPNLSLLSLTSEADRSLADRALAVCATTQRVDNARDKNPLPNLWRVQPRQLRTAEDSSETQVVDDRILHLLDKIAQLEEERHQLILREARESNNPNFDPYHVMPRFDPEDKLTYFGFAEYQAERKRFKEDLEFVIKDQMDHLRSFAGGTPVHAKP